VVPLMKGLDDVVIGTDEVLLHPPLQLVMVSVEVVNEVTITVVPLEVRVLVRGQTVVEVKIVMSRVSVTGAVVELDAEEVIKLLVTFAEEELAEDEVIKLLAELEVELRTGSTTEDVVALLP